MTVAQAEAAYRMGEAAFKAGKDYDDCPFTVTNEWLARCEWMNGFEDAQESFEYKMCETMYRNDE